MENNPDVSLEDLDFQYPEELVATEPRRPSRVLWTEIDRVPKAKLGEKPTLATPLQSIEKTIAQLLQEVKPGDVFVVNDSRVLPRRIFAKEAVSQQDLEILFLDRVDDLHWQVLMPSRGIDLDASIVLFSDETRAGAQEPYSSEKGMSGAGSRTHASFVTATLKQKGKPQILKTSRALSEADFQAHGELPLPPYIQKARQSRRNRPQESQWYQTAWAKYEGSLAAPTASLHFSQQDLEFLRNKGVIVAPITLHVGIGTFLPVQVAQLSQHVMHAERVFVPRETWALVQQAKKKGNQVWALGTTVTRTLESLPLKKIPMTEEGDFIGSTDLFIRPGFQWAVVDILMTNFHQPKSTLLALVASFAGLENVKSVYRRAIENNFRLFSYGDLSVWRQV